MHMRQGREHMAAGFSMDRTDLALTCKLLQQEPAQQMTHWGQDGKHASCLEARESCPHIAWPLLVSNALELH